MLRIGRDLCFYKHISTKHVSQHIIVSINTESLSILLCKIILILVISLFINPFTLFLADIYVIDSICRHYGGEGVKG